MRTDANSFAFLRRLSRVRAVERTQALGRLADARADQTRMIELASRSVQLAQDYTSQTHSKRADELAALLHFRGRLDELADAAGRIGKEAEQGGIEAGQQFTNAERRHDIVEQRITKEFDRTNRDQPAVPEELARNLLSKFGNCRGTRT